MGLVCAASIRRYNFFKASFTSRAHCLRTCQMATTERRMERALAAMLSARLRLLMLLIVLEARSRASEPRRLPASTRLPRARRLPRRALCWVEAGSITDNGSRL